jgi:Peptidase family M28
MGAARALVGCTLAGTLAACAATQQLSDPLSPIQSRMHDDLAYLASPALEGRLSGTPGNDSAAVFIARRYAALGLPGAYSGTSCGGDRCDSSYFQIFRLRPPELAALDVHIRDRTQNVGAIVRGTDSSVSGEFIVVGAHYDHIGRSNTFALDHTWLGFGRSHLGADDNASGTTAVLELARRFAERPPRRSIVLANFSAEEFGMIGSQTFVAVSPITADSVIAMVNLDMVGRLRGDRLSLFAGKASARFHVVVDSVNRLMPTPSLHFAWLPSWRGPSDQTSFDEVGIPVLGLFTDYHVDYHREGDVVDRINFKGLEKVVDFTERFVRAVADGRDRPAPQN